MSEIQTMVSAAVALADLLVEACEGGLPAPFNAEVTEYAHSQHPARDTDTWNQGCIKLQFHDLVELTQWALYFEACISDPDPVAVTGTTYRTHGYHREVPVTATVFLYTEEEAVSS